MLKFLTKHRWNNIEAMVICQIAMMINDKFYIAAAVTTIVGVVINSYLEYKTKE